MNDIFYDLISTNSACVDVFSSVKKFQQLQEERFHAYHLFNEGHKIYLGTAPQYEFARFCALVHQLTQDFKRISEEIVAIEGQLRIVHNGSKLADHIAGIQEAERHKLELMARWQLAKQAVVDHPDEAEREIRVLELKHRLRHVMDKINGHLEELRCKAADL